MYVLVYSPKERVILNGTLKECILHLSWIKSLCPTKYSQYTIIKK